MINKICLLIIGTVVFFLLRIVFGLTIDNYDAFQILVNAQSLAALNSFGFTLARPSMLPIVLSPIFIFTRITNLEAYTFAICHVLMIVFYAALIFTAFRLFILHTQKEIAWTAALLLSLNQVVVHMAPFCKEDVFALLLMTAAMVFYTLGNQSSQKKYYLFASLFIALSLGTRRDYLLLLASLFLYECWVGRFHWKMFTKPVPEKTRLIHRCLFTFPVLFYFFLILGSLYYASLWQETPKAPELASIDHFLDIIAVRQDDYVSPAKNLTFLAKSCSWPVLVCAVLGLITGWKKRFAGYRLFLSWLLPFLIYHTFILRHKEARYLLPALPPIYFFAAAGFSRIVQEMRRTVKEKFRGFVFPVLFCALLFLPLGKTAAELLHFEDPVYHSDFLGEFSRQVKTLTEDHKAYWLGPAYPLHPQGNIFDLADDYYAIYHVGPYAVYFTSGQWVDKLDEAKVSSLSPETICLDKPTVTRLKNHDVLILNPENQAYTTKNMPPALKPLLVRQVVKVDADLPSNCLHLK